MISVSKVPYKRIRIFLNPQLFLSGFKNLHVYTYPVNSTYESVTFLICSGSPEWKFLNTLWIRNRVDAKSGYLTLIGRSWAKYRDLSVASISIGWGKKIYLRDTDKSRYFAITDIDSIIVLSFDDRVFFSLLCAKKSAIFTQERLQEGEKRGFIYAWAEYYLQPNTVRRHCTWADH